MPDPDADSSPKTKQLSQRSDSSDKNTSYFLVRRSTRRTKSSDNASSNATPSIGSARPISPWIATTIPSIVTGHSQAPSSIDSALSDWNYSSTDASAQADPPRLPKDGYEWVWFPEGYWAEREVHGAKFIRRRIRPKWLSPPETPVQKREIKLQTGPDKRRTSDSGRIFAGSALAIVSRAETAPSTRKSSTSKSSTTSRHSSIRSRLTYVPKHLAYLSPTYPHFISPDGDPEGLYCKAKRNLGVQAKQTPFADTSSVLSTPSTTGLVLAGAASYLKRVKRDSNRLGDQDSTSEYAHSRTVGLAPWHRHGSTDSSVSASSSLRAFIMGKTPPATPLPSVKYTGSGGKEFHKVEISNPFHPAFLPSEAKKIETPTVEPTLPPFMGGSPFGLSVPVQEKDTHGQGSEARFTFHSSPLGQTYTSAVDRRGSRDVDCEAWLAKVESEAEVKLSLEQRSTGFEIDMPEHLPSSPLCPKNPKHRNGGTGICPFHGRRRTACPSHEQRALGVDTA